MHLGPRLYQVIYRQANVHQDIVQCTLYLLFTRQIAHINEYHQIAHINEYHINIVLLGYSPCSNVPCVLHDRTLCRNIAGAFVYKDTIVALYIHCTCLHVKWSMLTYWTKCLELRMGAGTGWAEWARAHPGNNLGGHCPPWISPFGKILGDDCPPWFWCKNSTVLW